VGAAEQRSGGSSGAAGAVERREQRSGGAAERWEQRGGVAVRGGGRGVATMGGGEEWSRAEGMAQSEEWCVGVGEAGAEREGGV